jgi:MscS family membrane protein
MTSKTATRAAFSALILLQLIFAANTWAQTPPVPATTNSAPTPATNSEKDPFGRETPQGMVVGLMNALSAADYDRALRFFATDSVQGTRSWYVLSGPLLARRFQEVLDRGGTVITAAQLSDDASGNVNDGLTQNIERFGVIKLPNGQTPLLAERVSRDGKQLWFVSEQTLVQIPGLIQSLDRPSALGGLVGLLPDGPNVAGAPTSHWLAIVAAAALSFALAWLLTKLRGPIERLFWPDGKAPKAIQFIEKSVGPVRLLLMLLVFGIAIQALELSVVARYRAFFVAQVVGWFAVTWLLWRWADAGSEVILAQMSRRGQLTAYSALSFLNRAIKALLAIIFAAALLRAFGFNVTAGLAALGVGGLAIALGAQKLFENLIGSLTIIADRPVRIGDFCRFGSSMGTIEEIGIRSTRIRTLDRTVLTVPNGEFAALHIENYAQRDRYWFHPVLNLRYETSIEQMRNVLQSLRSMLASHPNVETSSRRVRLIGLAAYSLDVEIFAYVFAQDYTTFLEIQEDLLLRCMEIVEENDTGFALPSQTLYLGRDGGRNDNRPREIADVMRGQREPSR